MRTIKFRGRRLDNGERVYGNLLVIEDTYFIIEPVDFSYNNDTDATAFWFDSTEQEVDPATVGQYTGLKDKNGKEIYEGDILAVSFRNHSDLRRIVEYGECEFILRYSKGSGYLRPSEFDPSNLDVIGNIHDNLDLLKTE